MSARFHRPGPSSRPLAPCNESGHCSPRSTPLFADHARQSRRKLSDSRSPCPDAEWPLRRTRKRRRDQIVRIIGLWLPPNVWLIRPSSPAAPVRRKFAESSPKVRRQRTLRENCIRKGQSARPPVSMASGRTKFYPRRLDATWANVGNPGLCRAGLGGGCRVGALHHFSRSRSRQHCGRRSGPT